MAVRVALDNIADSGLTNITCEVSDLLKQVKGKYELVTANIVADVIIRMAPDIGQFMTGDAVLIASGIISERCDEVTEKLVECNFRVVDTLVDNGWCALVVKKNI